MKLLLKMFRKIIFSAFLLYGYNFIAINFNLLIPINFVSLSLVTFLGSSGLFGLVLFKYLFL